MIRSRFVKFAAALAVLTLLAAACGDDEEEATTSDATTPADDQATAPPDDAMDDDMDSTGDAMDDADDMADDSMADNDVDDVDVADDMAMVNLADVCPSPIVLQTDWFPESEHGALYQLVGDDYTLDSDNMITSGSLTVHGEDLGIDIEVRAGGPAIGFASGSAQLYLEDEIHLAYVSMDEAVILHSETPTLSVVAPLEKNPQIIQWDPAVYPDIKSIADIGEAGLVVNVFGGGTFIDVFVNEGVLSADQIDPSYDGSPSRWIVEEGAIAQQGFASESPYSYENYEEWGKPIAYELIHDAGLEIYSQTLALNPNRLEELRPCLEQFVPIVQQAVVDFADSPDRANAIIIDAVETYASFWTYDEGLAEFSVNTQKELGLIGNGPDDTVGNMDEDRIQGVIDKIIAAGFDVSSDIQVSDIITNEFIDPSIGF